MTAREKIKQCSNSIFVSEQSELIDRLVYAFHEYTKEAIKADRLNLVEYVNLCLRTYTKTGFIEDLMGQEITSERENEYYGISKDSIINAPMIELK